MRKPWYDLEKVITLREFDRVRLDTNYDPLFKVVLYAGPREPNEIYLLQGKSRLREFLANVSPDDIIQIQECPLDD